MDDKALGLPEIVGLVSIAVFVLALFLPWFTVSVDDPSGILSARNFPDHNGWDAGFFFSLVPLLLGMGVLGLMLVPKLAPDFAMPDFPSWLPVVLGATAALLVLLKVLVGDEVPGAGNAETFGASIDVSRGLGLFIALLATIGMAAAGFMKTKELLATSTHGNTGATPPQVF